MAVVKLKNKKDSSLRRFHPWVFSGAIQSIDTEVKDGEIVTVVDIQNQFLAKGFYQSQASISVRAITFENEDINSSFWENKIQNATDLRAKIGLINNAKTNIFRLFHGEGDGIPGLIIDYYNGHFIIQAHTSGVHLIREIIAQSIQTVFKDGVKSIYYKSDDTLPRYFVQEQAIENQYLYKKEAFECPVICVENGHQFNINWETGQKTGFFIDQRENRKLIEKYSNDKKVLNTFCYSGGFSVYALNNKAKEVCSLDSSQKAIDLTEQNIALLDASIQSKHISVVADAVKYIGDLPSDYDVIILDPPAFAKSIKTAHRAVIGYKRINEAAIKQIKSGGVIFTFSCSQVIDKKMFADTVRAAAINAGRKIRILEQLHQPADHPINIFHPESEYLKGLVIEVL